MQATNSRPRFDVVADAQGVCSHVGAALLADLADRLGLTEELGRRANRGVRAGSHDRGAVLRDLVVMLADGGDCVSDLRTLRQQPELFGEVCSASTAWRVLVEEVGADLRGDRRAVVGAGQGPRACLGAGRSTHRAAAHRPGRDPDPGPL